MDLMTRTGETTYTTPSDREILISRVFDAPRELVFDAWTSPTHLPRWMTGPPGWTMSVCEVDLREGGAWKFAWKGEDGVEMAMSGEYREVVRPERVVSLERWGGDFAETINTMTLTESHGQTTLTLTVLYPSREARDAALATGMKEGMDMSFSRLDSYLGNVS